MNGVLLLLLALCVFITFTSFITKMHKDDSPTEFKAPTSGAKLSQLSWTEEELAQYGANLNEYEKNLYRLGIYMNKAYKGYDGKKGFDFPNENLSTLFMLGTDSTETGLRFFRGGQKDISKYPSDIPENGIGYGYLGLHTTEGIDNLVHSSDKYLRISSVTRDKVKQMYVPVSPPANQIRYSPWGGVTMGAKWNDKYYSIVNTPDSSSGGKNASAKIEEVMTQWGIQNNREQLKEFIELCLVQAQFHGAMKKEHTAYANFLCAFYVATGDNDADRSLDKWSYVGDSYDESSARKSTLGLSGNFRSVNSYGTPLQLPQQVGSVQWALNGQPIGKPLWTYLWEKFGDKSGMQMAWSQCQAFGNAGGGVRDRVLNFHYGLNSYYMGKKIESMLITKMGIPQKEVGGLPQGNGLFTETPGVGQMVWGGKTTDQHIAEYSGSAKSYIINTLKPQFGKSNGVSEGKQTDTMYGVPFYGQGKRFGECYGDLQWYPGCDTYNRSGCMVYSFAYALSAMTGHLVNPPEAGAILIMNGGLGGSGAVVTKWVDICKSLGLNAEITIGGGNQQFYGTRYFNKIDECLGKGGVVIIRAGGSPYAWGSNHFLVITGKHGDKYNIYTSPSPPQCKSLHTAQQLGAKMHREIVYIWK